MAALTGSGAVASLWGLLAGGADRGAEAVTREPPAGHVAFTAAPPQTVAWTLPFTGIWGVLQGMNSAETHVGYAAYAIDFVPAERLTAGPPPRRQALTDYPCFGREILATADGVVVWAQDGAPDGAPQPEPRAAGAGAEKRVGASPARATSSAGHGERRERPTPARPSAPAGAPRDPGNFIIVEHAPSEYSEYRHLQRGSVRVTVGASVHRGEAIARCGNSGNAGTPHLHLGFLGSIDPIATRPMRFTAYEVLTVATGQWKPGSGVPRAGELLRSTTTLRR